MSVDFMSILFFCELLDVLCILINVCHVYEPAKRNASYEDFDYELLRGEQHYAAVVLRAVFGFDECIVLFVAICVT
jgi:hypothetical protein